MMKKESGNLIGPELFGLYLMNQIFSQNCSFCKKLQNHISTFVLHQFQQDQIIFSIYGHFCRLGMAPSMQKSKMQSKICGLTKTFYVTICLQKIKNKLSH